MIRRAIGGSISNVKGQPTNGQDNIPALLMGGEYIVRRNAVQKYGADFFNKLNEGKIKKMANGGIVTPYQKFINNNNTEDNGVEESFSKLIDSTNSLKDSIEKLSINNRGTRESITTRDTTATPITITNSINVSIIDGQVKDTNAKTNTKTSEGGAGDNKNNEQMGKTLGSQLEAAVIKVIVDQSRIGGLLYRK